MRKTRLQVTVLKMKTMTKWLFKTMYNLNKAYPLRESKSDQIKTLIHATVSPNSWDKMNLMIMVIIFNIVA